MSHVKSRSNQGDDNEHCREYNTDAARSRRGARVRPAGIDANSLATVRELLREIRRLEQEIDHLSVDNEDLLSRMEDLLSENESLRRQCHSRSVAASFPDGRFKATPKSNIRRTWEELDERDSHRARSGREASFDEENAFSDDNAPAVRSSHVAFGGVDLAMSVPSKGSMRPTRSRVSTPYVSDAAVMQLDRPPSEEKQSTVSFEQNVHVVKVAVGSDDHIRSIRGRISTPFINDVSIAPEEEVVPSAI